MDIDFHTHGKLAKYLAFSPDYTDWLFNEAKEAGLDAICLTEHFNTQGFRDVYTDIAERFERVGDAYDVNGLLVFPGMETDVAEGGHTLALGPMEEILALNAWLEPHKERGRFLPFDQLADEVGRRGLRFGAGHPFRAPGHLPELSDEQLAEKLKEGRAELFNLRFQMATSQLDNTARVKVVKKDIARICTELRAREIRAAAEATA